MPDEVEVRSPFRARRPDHVPERFGWHLSDSRLPDGVSVTFARVPFVLIYQGHHDAALALLMCRTVEFGKRLNGENHAGPEWLLVPRDADNERALRDHEDEIHSALMAVTPKKERVEVRITEPPPDMTTETPRIVRGLRRDPALEASTWARAIAASRFVPFNCVRGTSVAGFMVPAALYDSVASPEMQRWLRSYSERSKQSRDADDRLYFDDGHTMLDMSPDLFKMALASTSAKGTSLSARTPRVGVIMPGGNAASGDLIPVLSGIDPDVRTVPVGDDRDSAGRIATTIHELADGDHDAMVIGYGGGNWDGRLSIRSAKIAETLQDVRVGGWTGSVYVAFGHADFEIQGLSDIPGVVQALTPTAAATIAWLDLVVIPRATVAAMAAGVSEITSGRGHRARAVLEERLASDRMALDDVRERLRSATDPTTAETIVTEAHRRFEEPE